MYYAMDKKMYRTYKQTLYTQLQKCTVIFNRVIAIAK